MSAMENLLPKNLDELSSDALRALVQQQAAVLAHHAQVVVPQKQSLAHKDEAIKTLELINSKLKYELAVIRRYRFGQKSEQYSGVQGLLFEEEDRKSTRLNSSHVAISYAVFCLKKKNKQTNQLLLDIYGKRVQS